MNRSLLALQLAALGLVGCADAVDRDLANDGVAGHSEALKKVKKNKMPDYVAVGDSVDYGLGATPGNGYTDQFSSYLDDNYFKGKMSYLNVAVPGATSQNILDNQTTEEALGNPGRGNKKRVITVGGGGNDLLGFMQSPAFIPCATGDQATCFANLGATLAAFSANLDETLARLGEFTEKKDSVLMMRTQYTGFVQPSCLLNGGIDAQGNNWLPAAQVRALVNSRIVFLALEGTVQDPTANDPFPGLNDIIRQKAAQHGAVLVDTFAPYMAAITQGQQIISIDCVHPNDLGYALLTDLTVAAFEEYLEDSDDCND